MREHKYILNDAGDPVPEPNLMIWGLWYEIPGNRHVAFTQLANGVYVSTIFLALDSNIFGDGPPILWETMIFGGPHDKECQRYSSREAALAGHQECVKLAGEEWPLDQLLGPMPEAR